MSHIALYDTAWHKNDVSWTYRHLGLSRTHAIIYVTQFVLFVNICVIKKNLCQKLFLIRSVVCEAQNQTKVRIPGRGYPFNKKCCFLKCFHETALVHSYNMHSKISFKISDTQKKTPPRKRLKNDYILNRFLQRRKFPLTKYNKSDTHYTYMTRG
jgi:hypothetical protein